MAEKIDDIKKEVWSLLKKNQPVFLATADGKQPRVRPVTLIHHDQKLWITTGTNSAKTKQLKSNPKTEFSWVFGSKEQTGCIRIAGEAKIVEDMKTKAKIAGVIKFFDQFWKGVDDPSYTLLHISPKEVEYMRPGEMKIRRFKL
jgi:general stress protein 26